MKILVIGLDYHSYTRAICDEFRLLGHEVKRHNIRGSLTLAKRAQRILRPEEYARSLVAFHHAVLEEARVERPDWVLFIQCHWLELATMQAFRDTLRDARITLYNWDSVTTHDYRPYLHMFDDSFTFDIRDSGELGIGYLPLFCIRDFQDAPSIEGMAPALYHVGNLVNPRRYIAIEEVGEYCAARGIRFQKFMKIRPVDFYRMWRNREKPKGLSFRAIKPRQFRAMMAESTAAFDFANHAQSGHTMRVMENLCAGRKIVTNSPLVKLEPFYSPDRVFIHEDGDYSGLKDFLDVPLIDPEERFPEYTVQRFARHLLDGTSHPVPVLAAAAA